MTLKECYEAFGGDYEDVISRLRTDERVKKFLLKFLDDSSMKELEEALQAEDYEEAFRAAHTLKGVCQNLGFTRLYASSHELTEVLRDQKEHDVRKLLEKAEEDYQKLVESVRQFQAGA